MRYLILATILLGCEGGVSSIDSDTGARADAQAGQDVVSIDTPSVDAPADSPQATDSGRDAADSQPSPEYEDVPDRDIEVNRDTPEVRNFEFQIADLDPEATSQPRAYFQSTEVHAVIDTRVEPRGQLMVWFGTGSSDYNTQLTHFAAYGYHVVKVPYANGWFSSVCGGDSFSPECRGNMRLEALTGMDLPTPDNDGNEVRISRADSAESRLTFILQRLAVDDPGGDWDYFLKEDGDLYWEAVAVSGASHGASTSTRFAVHRRLARAVPIVGPRDQLSNWQSLPSATPPYRMFAFSHEGDAIFREDPMYLTHYHRSWDLLGMDDYGDIVYVEDEDPPYSRSRQLLTRRPMDDPHGCCSLGPSVDGGLVFEDALRYIYTSDVSDHIEPE